jgi:hypothetical protein
VCGGADGSFAQQGVSLDPIFPSLSQVFCEEPVITLTIASCDHLPVLTYGQYSLKGGRILYFVFACMMKRRPFQAVRVNMFFSLVLNYNFYYIYQLKNTTLSYEIRRHSC